MNIVKVASWLNQGRVSAAPCEWLSAISIFVDEHYENNDYDLIGPAARHRISELLRQHGFRQLNGRVFEGSPGRIEFPRPTRSLASDPAEELEVVVDRRAGAVFATPTQILLASWRREGPQLSSERQSDLVSLVREQPANLDKVRDWLRRSECEAGFRRLEARLAAAQKEGFELRRQGKFRSQLPREKR
jgi:hypothetical protein